MTSLCNTLFGYFHESCKKLPSSYRKAASKILEEMQEKGELVAVLQVLQLIFFYFCTLSNMKAVTSIRWQFKICTSCQQPFRPFSQSFSSSQIRKTKASSIVSFFATQPHTQTRQGWKQKRFSSTKKATPKRSNRTRPPINEFDASSTQKISLFSERFLICPQGYFLLWCFFFSYPKIQNFQLGLVTDTLVHSLVFLLLRPRRRPMGPSFHAVLCLSFPSL